MVGRGHAQTARPHSAAQRPHPAHRRSTRLERAISPAAIRINTSAAARWRPTSPRATTPPATPRDWRDRCRSTASSARSSSRWRGLRQHVTRTASSPSPNGRPRATARGRSMPRARTGGSDRRLRARSGRRRHAAPARHALRRRLAGRQRARRSELARHQPGAAASRASICPPRPMQGLTTEWRGPSDLQIVAGGGVPGLYDGIVVPNFRTLDGSTATAGAQWSPASHWTRRRPIHRGARRESRDRPDDRWPRAHVLHHRPLDRRVGGSRRASADESPRRRGQPARQRPRSLGRRVDRAGPDPAKRRSVSHRSRT